MMHAVKAMEEANELIYEACEHISLAIEWKEDNPQLSQAFKETSANLITQAERVYAIVKEHAEAMPMDEVHKELWHYHKMKYTDKLAKAKSKHDIYAKM